MISMLSCHCTGPWMEPAWSTPRFKGRNNELSPLFSGAVSLSERPQMSLHPIIAVRLNGTITHTGKSWEEQGVLSNASNAVDQNPGFLQVLKPSKGCCFSSLWPACAACTSGSSRGVTSSLFRGSHMPLLLSLQHAAQQAAIPSPTVHRQPPPTQRTQTAKQANRVFSCCGMSFLDRLAPLERRLTPRQSSQGEPPTAATLCLTHNRFQECS